jgi:hypothetical protein
MSFVSFVASENFPTYDSDVIKLYRRSILLLRSFTLSPFMCIRIDYCASLGSSALPSIVIDVLKH